MKRKTRHASKHYPTPPRRYRLPTLAEDYLEQLDYEAKQGSCIIDLGAMEDVTHVYLNQGNDTQDLD